jgi:hypothetical protein
MTGCRHKTLRSALPIGVLAPVELEPTEPLDEDVMIAELPVPDLGPLPEPPAPPKPPVRHRPAPKEENPPQVAAAGEPLILGTLSTGDDEETQGQQPVRDLIASIVKRIAALPAKVADAQKRQVKQVKNFLDQAEKALNSGDAAGANNLATKARLLMDDLEKR